MKKVFIFGTLVLMLLVSSSSLTSLDSILSKFSKYHSTFPQEKTYLHLSKAHYRLGETIFFKAYLVNASTHLSETKSAVVRVELIDPNGKIVAKRILSKSHSRMSGDIDLDVSLNPGRYTIRAYTNWMRNFEEDFYSSTFNIFKGNGLTTYEKPNDNEKEIDLAFFPEGGDLIVGLENKVALKVIDRSGKGINIQGSILDDDGAKIASFETSALGFAQFGITPAVGQSYKAQLSTSGEEYSFDLPQALQKGYALSVSNDFDSDKTQISLTGKDVDLINSSLLIHQRGIIQYSTTIEESSTSFSVELSKAELSPGIHHLTVFDQNDEPVVERLFALNMDFTDGQVALEKDSVYTSGSSVELDISLQNQDKKAITGFLSASVTKENGNYYSHDQNIKNYLLLTSDLKGSVEKPSTYFNGSRESHESLDLLLLTQGWRRFSWNEVLSENSMETDFSLERRGVALTGTIVEFFNRGKAREGVISMSSLTNSTPIELNTDLEGRFRIPNINFPDSIDLIFTASRKVNKKGKLRDDTFIKMDKDVPPKVLENPLLTDLATTTIEEFIQEIDTSDLTLLDEVIIEGKQELQVARDPFQKAKTLYLRPSIRVVADSVFKKRGGVKSVAGFLRNEPGLVVFGSGPTTTVRLQGLGKQNRLTPTVDNTTPLFMIDGVPTDERSLFTLNPFDISYIDVLRGTEASLYGTRGSNGVFIIYLRPPELAKKVERPGSLFLQFPGYYAAKKFVFTDVMKANLAKDPLGVSVHWNPSVIVNDQGLGRLSFDLPNEPGNYYIRMEGIAENGSPIFLEEVILVQ